MANLTKINWPLGWTPAADNVGGHPDGLLRMDNLQQEETGALSLVRGIQVLSGPHSAYVESIFSRNIDGTEMVYASLAGGSSILKNGVVLTSGTDRAAFGDALGQVFICAGTTKKKDQSGGLKDLGLDKPSDGPTLSEVNQVTADFPATAWDTIEGHDPENFGDSIKIYTDATTLRAVVKKTFAAYNTTEMGGDLTNYDPSVDTFYWLIQPHDTSLFTKFRVELLLDDADTNYYWHEWTLDDDTFNLGINLQSILKCLRKDFERVGDDNSLNWTNIIGVRVMGIGISDTWFLTGEHRFVGGPKGVLNGFYQYASQAIDNNGVYLAKSPLSPSSRTVYSTNGFVNVTPSSVSGATEHWIFRRSVIQQVDTNLVQSHLDKWYFVGSTTGGALEDRVSDVDALRLNLTVSETLVSVKEVPDSILDIEGIDHERMIYMTFRDLLFSDRLNPDAIDARFTFRVSGDTTEKNLWFKKVTNELRVLATTKDLYEISGTLLDLPDGTIDVFIRSIGEGFPPISSNVASVEGGLYYAAKDGWRVTDGSNSRLISQPLDQLWQGKECNGLPGIAVQAGVTTNYPIAITRDKLYAGAPLTDGTRRLFILNLATKAWRLQYTDPLALGVTTDNRILAGYGGGSGNFIRTLEDGIGVEGGDGFPITLITVFDNNGQPRNRKDTFTLKLVMDTGGAVVSISLGKDGESYTHLADASSNGLSTLYYTLDGVTLGFRYSLKIVDKNGDLQIFKLQEYTIEYDPRPEQVNYLRIPSTNLGTLARKRFVSFAFVIDTLGTELTFTPYVDGAAQTPTTFTKNGKLTYVHFFTSNMEGTDIGGLITGGVFEYYGPNLEESVSEKLPTPTKYLVIPANDYGNPNRKRHTSYKFQINTKGHNVRFTPEVDGVSYAPLVLNTAKKRTVEYFFDQSIDVVGIDIGGILETVANQEFEFYGTIVPQELEILPPRLKSYYLPFNNFQSPARKRMRTLPLVIDTGGSDVTFTPIVDGVGLPPTTFNTPRRQTVYHYFSTDVFGIDFGGTLLGEDAFEFYGFAQPENVETLPVPKKYDQLQPMRFDKIGKIFAFRCRIVAIGSTVSIPFSINGEAQPMYPEYNGTLFSGSFPVVPNCDDVYEVQLPKNVNATIVRIILGPTEEAFHRYDLQARVSTSGMETDAKWIPVR